MERTVKQQAREIIDQLPDDATWADVGRALHLPFVVDSVQQAMFGAASDDRDPFIDNLMMRGLLDLMDTNQLDEEQFIDEFDLILEEGFVEEDLFG